MNGVRTYPKMNETIKDLLRDSEEPMMQYALARIEELEAEVAAYKEAAHDRHQDG